MLQALTDVARFTRLELVVFYAREARDRLPAGGKLDSTQISTILRRAYLANTTLVFAIDNEENRDRWRGRVHREASLIIAGERNRSLKHHHNPGARVTLHCSLSADRIREDGGEGALRAITNACADGHAVVWALIPEKGLNTLLQQLIGKAVDDSWAALFIELNGYVAVRGGEIIEFTP